MGSQENDARVAGEKIGKAFFDAFEVENKSPSQSQLSALRDRWNEHLVAQRRPWGEGHALSNLMLEAATLHFEGRVKFHSLHRSRGGAAVHGQGAEGHDDPRINPERGWGPPSGIARHDSNR
ncbi:hypothetical protein ACVWZ6_005595 [Bradyrhizobium sp. GM6.1]